MKLYARKQSFPGVSGQKKGGEANIKKKNPHKVEGDQKGDRAHRPHPPTKRRGIC